MNTLGKLLALFSAFCVIAVFSDDANAQCAGCSVGPGTEMTQMINRVGLGADCGRCKALAAQMDRCGSDWVCNNFDHVVCRTISNAENLGHRMGPMRRASVRALVRTAVRRASY